jgi:hypothetical protein
VALATLYKDVSVLENSQKNVLKLTLKSYTTYVLTEAWPMQKQGEIPLGGTIIMNTFQKQIANYKTASSKDEIYYSQVLSKYNVLMKRRLLRLNAVKSSLPATIWVVLLLVAFINIMFTGLLDIKNNKLDIILHILMVMLLASLIFLINSNKFYNINSFKLLLE